ncbi:hypothetical protein P7266_1681 [Lactococcus cremoris]|nr:hypothetical protein P7266_1681 [Lactococcus cremoris]
MYYEFLDKSEKVLQKILLTNENKFPIIKTRVMKTITLEE